VPDAGKIDPFDIEALERAVNDSATRVSAIWISFLVFSLYLLIAATTVSQRQLLLADPVKLPVLNIDLPLWGFFFLAPILFVILHAYVLLQVLLLGRTTAAYNTAVARLPDLSADENASLRQRLANTLFAQIFAGSPREREGFVGSLLRAIVWITLAIAPILIVLAFQFSFLAYHSHIATWTHRLLILVELTAFFLIWPLALDAQRDFRWPRVWLDLRRVLSLPLQVFGPIAGRNEGWSWLRQRTAPLSACVLFVLVSLSIASFPGEPHVNLFNGQPPLSVECERRIQRQFERIDLRFDRLNLRQSDIVDADKFARIVSHTSERGLSPSQGERTLNLRDRNLDCADLSSTDMRRVDLTGARLSRANLSRTALQGATLDNTQLQGAFLFITQLEHASLDSAQLQGARLDSAQLQHALLGGIQLQGALLWKAQLQQAKFDGARFQGASFSSAALQGASFVNSEGQGASFEDAQLQGALFLSSALHGASFANAWLQGTTFLGNGLYGAVFKSARLQGAMLDSGLQGTDFSDAELDHTILLGASVWRAKNAACQNALVIQSNSNDSIDGIKVTPLSIASFVERSFADIPGAFARERLAASMRQAMTADPANDDTAAIAKVWSDCEAAAAKISRDRFYQELATLHRKLVCDATEGRAAIARGIVDNWIEGAGYPPSIRLPGGLPGLDGKGCAPTSELD